MAAVSGGPLRRRALTHLGPGRRSGFRDIDRINLPRVWPEPGRFQEPTARRVLCVEDALPRQTDKRRFGERALAALTSSLRPSALGSPQFRYRRTVVLSKTGADGPNGGGETAAVCWPGMNRRRVLGKIEPVIFSTVLLLEQRDVLPAEWGDVVAYIGFISVGVRVGLDAARYYLPAVSQYHLDHGFASPTLTRMVTQEIGS